MGTRTTISAVVRKLAGELVSGSVPVPTQQYVYYQELDRGYPTTTEEGAGKHMNAPGGHEWADTNHPNDPSNYEDDLVQPLMTVRPGDRRDYEPDTSFHTSPYASEEKSAAAPWGEQYSRPRGGGVSDAFGPATKPRGCGHDCWEQQEGQIVRNQGAPHDYSMGDQDSGFMFSDRANYPSIPRS